MAGPLSGVRILDISERSPAAANAGMILADYGAEVIRVEPEGGDPIRALKGSSVWLRGQKSVVVGAREVSDGAWMRLRATADVVIDTAHPWTDKPSTLLDGWGDDSRQVLCVLTALPEKPANAPKAGENGLPVYGELGEARFGFNVSQAGFREGPIFLGWPLMTYGAAWLMEIGVIGALFERERTGLGQVVTTSLLDGAAILSTHRWSGGEDYKGASGSMMAPGTPRTNARSVTTLLECADGRWVQTHTGARGSFDRLMRLLGREDLIVEGAPRGSQMEPEQADEMWRFIEETFKSKPAQHWVDVMNANDVCCMPALDPGEGLFLEQMLANGLVDVFPDGGRRFGVPVKFGRTPIRAGRALPRVGEHDALLQESPGPIEAIAPPKPAPNGGGRVGPLDGVLVIDLGFFMAGPFGPRNLADLGARVIKVEEVNGDPMRGLAVNAGFLGVQGGKEAIGVNLKTEEGREIVYDLVRKADIVHHNMRQAALPRLGIDYETLRKVNPRIIYCHSSGYGNDGPWSAYPTLEPLHSALTGMLVRTAGEGNRPLHYTTHMDYGCCLTSTFAVVAALYERERSGQGEFLEVPQTGAGFVAMSDVFIENEQVVETFALDKNQRGHAPTNALYRTGDGWIVLACYSDREWQAVPGALGLPDASWPSYRSARGRASGDEPSTYIQQALLGMTTTEAEKRLAMSGVRVRSRPLTTRMTPLPTRCCASTAFS